jgi:hypothetical protein
VAIETKSAHHVMDKFHNTWLSRYPRPQYIVFDNGGEFKNLFLEMIENFGIKAKPTTHYNPQANSILERVHQVLANMLRTQQLDDTHSAVDLPWDDCLASAAWAIRSTYHTTLGATPGQLVFGRDMIHNVSYTASWDAIQKRKQTTINASNKRENSKRLPYTYNVGDQVTIEVPGITRKLSGPRTGPHTITKIYTNGTVRVKHGIISERMNIRRIQPFHTQPNN